jgi:hypothetical protein
MHGTLTIKLIRYRGVVDWPLLRSFSLDRYYVGSKNPVLWDVFTAVSIMDVFWDTEPRGSS